MTKKELLINHAINVFFCLYPNFAEYLQSKQKQSAPAKNGLQCTKMSSSKTFHAENSANLGLGKDKFNRGWKLNNE